MTGFRLKIDLDIAPDITAVLSRVSQRTMRSLAAAGVNVHFSDIFNCLSTFITTIKRTEGSYILETGGEIQRTITTWKAETMVDFFRCTLDGKLEGLAVSQREASSISELIAALKDVYNVKSTASTPSSSSSAPEGP